MERHTNNVLRMLGEDLLDPELKADLQDAAQETIDRYRRRVAERGRASRVLAQPRKLPDEPTNKGDWCALFPFGQPRMPSALQADWAGSSCSFFSAGDADTLRRELARPLAEGRVVLAPAWRLLNMPDLLLDAGHAPVEAGRLVEAIVKGIGSPSLLWALFDSELERQLPVTLNHDRLLPEFERQSRQALANQNPARLYRAQLIRVFHVDPLALTSHNHLGRDSDRARAREILQLLRDDAAAADSQSAARPENGAKTPRLEELLGQHVGPEGTSTDNPFRRMRRAATLREAEERELARQAVGPKEAG